MPADLVGLRSPDEMEPSDMSALGTETSQHETVPVDTPTTSTRLSVEDSVATNTFALNIGTDEVALGVDIAS